MLVKISSYLLKLLVVNYPRTLQLKVLLFTLTRNPLTKCNTTYLRVMKIDKVLCWKVTNVLMLTNSKAGFNKQESSISCIRIS